MNPLALAFRLKRSALGFSRKEMADYLSVTDGYIKKIELGKSRPGPSVVSFVDHAMDTFVTQSKNMNRAKALKFLKNCPDNVTPGERILRSVAVSKLSLIELLELETGATKS